MHRMTKQNIKQMNIVHINVESPFMDNSGYQETLLAKCHKKLCNNVTIINNNLVLSSDGSISICTPGVYYNEDQVKIIRMSLYDKAGKKHIDINGLYDILVEEHPDFIMIHGVFCFDVLAVAKYIRKIEPKCIVVADSHATCDNANIMCNNPKNIVFRSMLKIFNKYMCRYYKKVYGIMEDAVDLMVKYAGVPNIKTDILELGYDETLIDYTHKTEIRSGIREKYSISEESFLIAHGGKLDKDKRTAELIDAVSKIDEDIHIIVFGEFSDEEYEKKIKENLEEIEDRIHFVGMLTQQEIYNLYLASDCAVFPGTASCLRQQAVASGLPIVIGYLDADSGINLLFHDNGIRLKSEWKEQDLCEAIIKIFSQRKYTENAVELMKGEYKKYSYMYQAEQLIADNL